MTQTIEFTTKINKGIIQIPPQYYQDLNEDLEVEVIVKLKQKKRLMDELAESPIPVNGWRQLTREEINSR
jgi:hypothetical protein